MVLAPLLKAVMAEAAPAGVLNVLSPVTVTFMYMPTVILAGNAVVHVTVAILLVREAAGLARALETPTFKTTCSAASGASMPSSSSVGTPALLNILLRASPLV